MEQEQIEKMCLESSDKNYHIFLHNEGWMYDTEAAAIAGYERLKKSTLGSLLSEEEFLEELSPADNAAAAKRLYHTLRSLAEQGILKPLELYQYAKYKWCRNRPEAVVACQIGPKRWMVNNCGETISKECAILLLNSEWGFEASRIELLDTPYYDSTDWNFIRFRCGPYDWLMKDGELCQIYQ